MFESIVERALAMQARSDARPSADGQGDSARRRKRRRQAKGEDGAKPRSREAATEDRRRAKTEALDARARAAARSAAAAALSTDHTANDSRRRSWRAIAVVQNGPVHQLDAPVERRRARAAPCARRRSAAALSSDGRPVLAITTSTGRSIARDTQRAASAAVKPAMPLPSVSRFAIRMTGPSHVAPALPSRRARAAAASGW